MSKNRKLNRREFIKKLSFGSASAVAMMAFEPIKAIAAPLNEPLQPVPSPDNNMTYRVNRHTNDKVSLLGYGMMRLPMKDGQIDQEMVNKQVDYAIAHGVNYFDTAPVYCKGQSETATGIALHRYPRDKYFIATKMSNSNEKYWDIKKAKEMYHASFKHLQVDYIDYYLMHAVGGGGVDRLKKRFIDNGLLDYLLDERKAGRIRNLGFSYHGDVAVFDWLLDHQDTYQFDFVQIQLNYVDWRHASMKKEDADAEYLYTKCEKLGIQNVVMEPLLGSRLAKLPQELAGQLTSLKPDKSVASWAFRWVGSLPNILVALSGMTYMEHLIDNVNTFSPLDPCTESEKALLAKIANQMAGYPTIPCTACHYCTPCPYGVEIPDNFSYYNEAVNAHLLPLPDKGASDYAERRKKLIEGFRKAIPENGRADQCMDCEACLPKCPQQIRIPIQMARLVELMR
ncbi:MAG: aldo/keto reductase [Prevotella sp.]|nr:aldo/keto reductase [Prevotella sp.]